MKTHTILGEQMLGGVAFLQGPGLEIVRNHHERWDGERLSRRLRGDEIPLGARIFAVADSLDAMTSDRPYRSAALVGVRASREILEEAGKQFDPAVVEAFRTASRPCARSPASSPRRGSLIGARRHGRASAPARGRSPLRRPGHSRREQRNRRGAQGQQSGLATRTILARGVRALPGATRDPGGRARVRRRGDRAARRRVGPRAPLPARARAEAGRARASWASASPRSWAARAPTSSRTCSCSRRSRARTRGSASRSPCTRAPRRCRSSTSAPTSRGGARPAARARARRSARSR